MMLVVITGIQFHSNAFHPVHGFRVLFVARLLKKLLILATYLKGTCVDSDWLWSTKAHIIGTFVSGIYPAGLEVDVRITSSVQSGG
jgi:hypothetical protein